MQKALTFITTEQKKTHTHTLKFIITAVAILRNVDQDGAGTAIFGEEKGLANNPRSVIYVEDKVIVLGDGSGYFDDGGFLEGIGADHAAGDLVGNGDKGSRCQGGRQRGRSRGW